jgi:hypothetical protein
VGSFPCCSTPVALLFDLLIECPEGIEVVPLFADNRQQALQSGWEMYPGQRVAVVLKQSEPGGEVD